MPNLSRISLTRLPVALALVALIVGGGWLLTKSDKQARDTIRKHHLEDIEQSLYLARSLHGTYPPYDQPTWCGTLNDPANTQVRIQVEEALRAQNEKYKNQEKPFPHDPGHFSPPADYFYWKRSPAIFELYAVLEADPNGEKTTRDCPSASTLTYDYGITSVWRENRVSLQP